MDDRLLDLTEAQQATKAKYPPINKKYECKSQVIIIVASLISLFTFTYENGSRSSFHSLQSQLTVPSVMFKL